MCEKYDETPKQNKCLQTSFHFLNVIHALSNCGPLTPRTSNCVPRSYKVQPTHFQSTAHALTNYGPRTRKMRPTHHTLTCKVRGPYLPRTTAAVLTAWRATAWKRLGSKRVKVIHEDVVVSRNEKLFHWFR